jgi:chromate reductase, NAD(P)H dehydrogenase (quinone)
VTAQPKHAATSQSATSQTLPPAVSRVRQAIRRADGIIIATPEYNHAIPGVLKNALDWASRPTTDLPLTGKPIAVFVATRSRVLGHRALSDTARILTGFANIVIPGPEVIVTSAHNKLTTSPDGTIQLTDPYTAAAVQQQLAILLDLIATGSARQLGNPMRQHVPARWWW